MTWIHWSLLSAAFAGATAILANLGVIGRRPLAFLVPSGLATGLSWVCYFRAHQHGEASRVAPVDKLSGLRSGIRGLVPG